MEYLGFILDRFQEEAIRFIDQENSLIVSAPTGSGKTLIAEYAIEKALRAGHEVLYTAPIKALSNQKFRDFTYRYGNNVGIMTGDVTLHSEAPLLIMTTEIFRNALLEDTCRFDNVSYLILDEVHYLDDAERGSVWEESIIFAPPHIKILCLSATVPNVEELANWISRVRNEPVQVIQEAKRPIPLVEYCFMDGQGAMTLKDAKRYLSKARKDGSNGSHFDNPRSFHELLQLLSNQRQIPCLYFVFSRKECEHYAYQCSSYSLLDAQERAAMEQKLQNFSNRYHIPCTAKDYGLGRLLARGVAYHHAGMLPAFKEVVEQLFTEGLIKLLFATETFALGVNMPASSVVFHSLKKYDGISVRNLKALEYQQMSGRAGRRGLDSVGYVYANLSNETVASDDLQRIVGGPLEPICSQFDLAYSTLLNLYDRVGEEVVKTCDKSFGTYHRMVQAQKKGGKKQKHKVSTEQRKLVKQKLGLLQTLGYLTEKGLTSKGKFASRISGYEVPVTELFYDGVFEKCKESDFFVMLVALVFEGKNSEWYPKLSKDLQKIAKQTERCIGRVQKLELMCGLSAIKSPDFRLAPLAYDWATGKTFAELTRHSSCSQGDIIRNFRLAIQLCRQLRKACTGYKEFEELVDHCLMAVNRDEVNALKQMEAFLGKPVRTSNGVPVAENS